MSWKPVEYVRGEVLIVTVEMPVKITEEALREWYRTQWTNGEELPADFDPDSEDGEDLLIEYVDTVYYAEARGDNMGKYVTSHDDRDTWRKRVG